MGEEIAKENGLTRISDFQGLVTFTLDRAIQHTVMHHWSTSRDLYLHIKFHWDRRRKNFRESQQSLLVTANFQVTWQKL